MKKSIVILLLFLTFVSTNAREYFEKGDALYRSKKESGIPNFGHCGVYWYWETNMAPANREAHWELEASTEIGQPRPNGGVWSFTFKYFYERTQFWSVRTMPGLDWKMRNKIVETAEEFRYRYTEYDALSGYKNPLGDPPTFRCDGLVEYCYEIALGHDWEPGNNGGIIINDVWSVPLPGQHILYPWRQMEALELRESAELHYISIKYPVEGYTIKGSFVLTALASDGLFGSGTAKVVFYVDDDSIGTDAHEHTTADWYNYEWDSRTVTNGEHTLRVKGYDQAGNDKEDEVTFYVDNPIPRVVSTDPDSGAENVDVYKKITIVFNKPMDTTSVRSALEIMNLDDSILVQIREINWEGDDKTMIIRAYDPVVLDDTTGFNFLTNYEVTIKGTAEDTSGVTLDGDKDGKSEGSPEDDYPFDFKTRNPKFDLSLNPWLSKVELGGTATIEVSVTNEEQRDLAVYLSHIPEQDPNWLITLEGGLNVPANETAKTNLIVKNRWNPGSINILVTGKSYEREHSASAFVWASDQYGEPNPPPAGCDENYSISNPNMPSPWILNPYAKVGILLSGYAEGMGHLLGRYKIPTAIVLDNFEILGAIERPLSDLNVLIIPTGGLIPYCNLPPYQDKLSEYVEQGGTLICFTQSYGYVFEALPGSPGGYGWREDKSCHAYACYLNLWDTFLSGQNNVIFDGNMDGYITQYPTNAEPFLIRIANGYPGFIRYPYYQGEVILTTCYTDFAYRFGGSFKDEMALIRDLITSYVVLDSITEFYKDSTVTLSAPIYYPVYEDSIPANKAGVITYYPNRESLTINQINLTPPMIPGDTQIISLPSISAPCSLGIYPIMFTLYQDTLPVTEEEYSNAFAVKCSIPVGNYNLGDFQIWTTVESESVLYGMPINFSINVRNNSPDTFLGNIYIGQGGGQISYDDSLMDLVIPPDTVSLYNWEAIAKGSRDYVFWLRDSLNQYLGLFVKWIEVWPAKAQVTINTDLPGYMHNDTAYIDLEFLPNYEGIDTFSVGIFKSKGWFIPPDTFLFHKDTISYYKDGTSYAFPFFIEESLALGTYQVRAQAFWHGKRTGSAIKQFNVIGPEINFTLKQDTAISGDDTTKFIVSINPGYYIFKNVNFDYRVVYNESLPDTLLTQELVYDTLQNGDTLFAPFSINQDQMNFGKYDFRYCFKSLDTLYGKYDFSNNVYLGIRTNQFYRWGDTLNVGIHLLNLGSFEIPVWLYIEVEKPNGNYRDSMEINLDISTHDVFYFQTLIDSGIPNNNYSIWAYVRSANSIKERNAKYRVIVNFPNIMITTDTTNYNIGDTVAVIIYNAGELEGDVRLTEVTLKDIHNDSFPMDTAWFTIPGGEFAFYKFTVPEVMSGPYYLNITGNVENYNIPINEREYLWFNGIEADISLRTSKDIYRPDDEVKPQANCVNGNYQFNGDMNLSIIPAGLHPGDTTFIPGDEDMWQINNWTSPGCTLSNNKLTLMGWDKFYGVDSWVIFLDRGRGGDGISSKRELILRILAEKKQGKPRGGEPIRYTAMASHNGELYASMTTDIRRKIVGVYPDWQEDYDLSDIASIYQFAMDENYFYIVDIDSEYVYKVSQNTGTIEKRWKVSNPRGIGLFSNNLYLVDRSNHSIIKTNLDGDTILIFGSDSLVEPEDLAVDGSGNIFVSDLNKAKVYVFNSDGSYLETKGAGRFSQITIDEKGYLYGVDMDSLKAVKYDENGELIEYYLCWSYPDEIMANDTLIHFAHISIYHDWVTGEVLANYGRSKGYSITKEFLWIPVTFVTDFIPTQSKNSGSIDWFFSFFIPEKERQYEHWIPIDSIEYFNFEEEETPIFKPLLTNPAGGTPPEVEKFELHYITRRYGTVVWEDTAQLKFTPNDSILIERNAGVFADTGEFILWGDITLDNGQQYPSPKMHNFYIKPSLLSLGLKTDRDIYYPGESVLMSAVVVNNGDTAFTNVTLEMFKRDENIFDTLITSLAPQSACSLSTVLSDSNMFVLTGLLFKSGADTVKEYKDVDVVTPPIFFSSTYPCSVDHKPFEVTTEVTNYWEREVDIIFRCSCGDSECIDTLLLYPEESRAIEYQFTIEKDESLKTEIIHPVVSHKSYPIRFGEKLEITIDSVISSENSILIPYYINNAGEFDCIFELHLQIADTAGFISDSTNCTHLLPIGDSLSGEWGVSLDYGEYMLNWTAKPESSTVILSQGTTSVSIIPQNMVTIDSIVLLTECDSIGMLIFDIPVRNNSANTFYGNAGLYANFIYETQELELEPLTIDTIRFTNNAVLEEGYHQLTAKILQNGEPLFEFTDSIYFTPSIYIDSLPELLTFNIGDTAEICITTGNRGTSNGEETLSFEFGEFGEETRLISLIPGEVRTDTFIFYMPEDLEERIYYASVWLGSEEYILPVHILGYKILVDATLNQPNFSPGDTVRLNLTIENRNERNLKGFSVANYNGEPVTQNFLLSGFAENIDFSNPEFIKAFVDSGVYVSPVLWLGNFDSLIVEPEGGGTFDFWTRIVEPDSIHYSNWIGDSVIIGTEQALLLQFKVAFFDPMSNLERINVRLYDNATFKDTVIEEFNPVDLAQEFIFGFEPLVNLMFYGVYTETGRGLWLNTIYIFEANDTCNIITDKQVYYMGDTVYATVQSPYTGKLIWSSDFFPFGTISDSLWIDTLTEQFEFVLPEELSSGSYAIDFAFNIDGDTLQGFSAAQPFNVSGYQVQVFECRLDTNEYLPNDSIFIHFKLNSNKPIPLISKLRFVQNYQWYEALVDTIDIDSGFNVINMATVVPTLERGIAFLSYSFYKDSIFLTHSQEGFMIYLPDTMPPIAQFIEVPENTYNPNTAYTVKITATDEMRMYDTLYYYNGYMQNRITHQTQKGDTLIYKIPSQPRGTHIAFYITVKDSFGNMVRLPEVDYKQFWVMSALPPSECETDTVNQNIEISWENPSENLIYHSGYPYEERMDSIAVRFTPQYLPAELRSISVFAEKTIPDTAILSVSFHSVDAGIPGYEICPSQQIDVTEDGANWVEVQVDSIPVTEEIFIIFSAEDINLYGDGNKYVYRTLVKDDMWMADTAFGNLLAHTGCYYEPDSIFYLVMREDSSQFVLIADSLFNKAFTDSVVNGERRYRYLVKTHYMIPDLNSTSPILTQMYDYTPPLFGDSVTVIESDSGYFIGCEITDGIGIVIDSLIYNDIGISNDSIVNYWYWYTIPDTGQTIAYYFMAIDSAENTARNPDSGYFYIIPHIPEGFSGHISRDTTWSTDIVIKGDVWVDSGVVLTIDAGVNVRFVSNFDDEHAGIDTSRAEFIIIGDLTLLGNDSMHVTFTSNSTQPQTDDWYGIRFVELGEKDITIGEWESIPKKQTLVERKASETLLPCPVENEREDDNLEISDDELDKESIEKLVEEWRRRIDERCTGVLLENITIEYAKNGISFLRTGYFILRNSFIRDCCESGVNFEEEWGWVIMDSIVLERTNIGIKSEAPVWLFDGVITGCDSIGVYLSGWDGIIWESSISQNGIGILSSSNSFPYIWYTDLMGNSTGIFAKEDSRPWVRNSKIIGNSSYGIYITDNAKPNLGYRGLNCIFGSELYDLYNNTANRIVAKRNYWGTMNIDTVEAHIYDYYDNDSLGVVVVEPLWEGEGEQGIGGPMLAGDETTPLVYAFKSISPNPFCNSTTITYSIAKPGNVSIDIFDISGRLIKTLLTEMKDDRVYNVEWNGCDNLNRKLTTGVYFIRLTSGSFTSVKKIIFVR